MSAGAGSGKTTMLVERAARAVEDGVDPEAIFVVTFTERAAGELAERLRERLAISGASDRADRVRVSTIHGLCGSILREHAFALGLDPEFRVLDEASAAIVRGEALEQALAEAADERRGATLDLLAAFGGVPLRQLVVRLRARRLSCGLDLAPEPPPPVDLEAPRAAVAASARVAIAYYAERPSPALRGTASAPPSSSSCCALRAPRTSSTSPRSGCKDAPRPSRATRSSSPHSRPRRASRSCASCIRRSSGSSSASIGPTPPGSSRARRSTSQISSCARAISSSATPTRERRCRTRVRHLLVDEFQDTNALQDSILELVAGPEAERCYVGDERQSIYRFRDADVEVFRRRRAAGSGRSSGWTTASARPIRSSRC